jgi:tRNA (adenine57-N1/adenine58-N1)-methyltransferase
MMIMKILIKERGKKFIAGTDDLHTDQGYIKKRKLKTVILGDVLKTHLGGNLGC